jgi:two-component system sensor histidine kinase CpxA
VRRIFTKIFLWFWFAMAMLSVAMVIFAVFTGYQPIGRRWISQALDLYAHSSVDFYTHGGQPMLKRYLDDIQQSSGIQAALVDPEGKDVSGRGLPDGTLVLVERARGSHESQIRTSLPWTGAMIVPSAAGNYVFVARVFPLRGLLRLSDLRIMLLRLALAILSAGALCFLLARHIANPIRDLQSAVRRIAEGDFSVRAAPGFVGRKDELADLARDFDAMAQRVQSLLQKQQELLGDISHELRSPLTRLTVSLELARRGDSEALERMGTDIDRLGGLIGQILTLTRLQAQTDAPAHAPVRLGGILESVADDARLEGKENQISVQLELRDDCWLTGDPNLLRSCLENVVRNALRYTRPGTAVVIQASVNGGARAMAEICIRDEGPGVPPEALARLFEPFFRVSEARDRSTGGSGLGLAISQKVAKLYGGSIRARNREGGGLEVEIILPAHRITS